MIACRIPKKIPSTPRSDRAGGTYVRFVYKIRTPLHERLAAGRGGERAVLAVRC